MQQKKEQDFQGQCRRCGTCCTQSPPALHAQDLVLYEDQVLGKEHLLTLRTGELVLDNIQQKVLSLEQEMVRLQSRAHSKTCIFYEQSRHSCKIYSKRPLECRALECWNTGKIHKVYQLPRLKRWDMVAKNSALGSIMQEHENKCPLTRIKTLVQEVLQGQKQSAKRELSEMVRIDNEMRNYLRVNAGAGHAQLLFIFGRSLTAVLPALGLQVQPRGSAYDFQVRTRGQEMDYMEKFEPCSNSLLPPKGG